MRIAVVGPVSPFRSGIAMHTTALADALDKRADTEVRVFSFSRQYPRFLYPGADDRSTDTFPTFAPAAFTIDSLSPVTWRRSVQEIHRYSPDIVILPAWTFFLAPALGWIARACRKRGIRVVTVVHNASDHEAARWKTALSRFQLVQSNCFITHNQALADAVERLVGNCPIAVHPHPIYEHYPAPTASIARRGRLELLFFGIVRRYKGLDIALDALALARRRDIHLRVVGEFWEDRGEIDALVARLGLSERVEFVPRFVSDIEAANYFAAADVVLLPYRAVTGSGVVPVAYRYGKPVIVTDLPGLTDVVQQNETGWTVPVADPGALALLLDTTVTADIANGMQAGVAAMRRSMSWESFASTLLALAGSACTD